MHRRSLLLGAAAATLARPAIGNTTKTLKFVPQAALSSIDPVWTSAMTVRNFGMMVFETLYGRDATMRPRPQMLAFERRLKLQGVEAVLRRSRGLDIAAACGQLRVEREAGSKVRAQEHAGVE